jgi:hypothetical protein
MILSAESRIARAFSESSPPQGTMMGGNRFRIDMPRYIDFYLQISSVAALMSKIAP